MRRAAVIAVLVILIDRVTKAAVRAALDPTESVPLIPSLLHLTYVQNTGAAFGLFEGRAGWFAIVALGVIGWVVTELRRVRRDPQPWVELGLALILGGAIGNLIDRLRWGYVVDFIDLRIWPVFNVADSCITIGIGLLLWQAFRRRSV